MPATLPTFSAKPRRRKSAATTVAIATPIAAYAHHDPSPRESVVDGEAYAVVRIIGGVRTPCVVGRSDAGGDWLIARCETWEAAAWIARSWTISVRRGRYSPRDKRLAKADRLREARTRGQQLARLAWEENARLRAEIVELRENES